MFSLFTCMKPVKELGQMDFAFPPNVRLKTGAAHIDLSAHTSCMFVSATV